MAGASTAFRWPIADDLYDDYPRALSEGSRTMAKKFRELIEKMPVDRQVRIERRAEELLVEMPLQAVREARNLSQQFTELSAGAPAEPGAD